MASQAPIGSNWEPLPYLAVTRQGNEQPPPPPTSTPSPLPAAVPHHEEDPLPFRSPVILASDGSYLSHLRTPYHLT
ncbi:hypothetical protein H2248_011237 [Termitomyces sp. 'cryptogamus']|nr:hypothetical protein H2248_011237 [Termitomyces sp. 'cryptogamus']